MWGKEGKAKSNSRVFIGIYIFLVVSSNASVFFGKGKDSKESKDTEDKNFFYINIYINFFFRKKSALPSLLALPALPALLPLLLTLLSSSSSSSSSYLLT